MHERQAVRGLDHPSIVARLARLARFRRAASASAFTTAGSSGGVSAFRHWRIIHCANGRPAAFAAAFHCVLSASDNRKVNTLVRRGSCRNQESPGIRRNPPRRSFQQPVNGVFDVAVEGLPGFHIGRKNAQTARLAPTVRFAGIAADSAMAFRMLQDFDWPTVRANPAQRQASGGA